ncbi:MAG: F0F1 ATP synthase subunit B [Nitrospinota bacterium]|jgi:F-type H+-transporting ATPase subunit b|nr:ATP synthase F0 subunit B [Nitrospinota bacterium]MDP7350946.1 F0F1 ATP synthase subunit B [Nitrospinota bacterium]MDP7554894.1 F0F1 ATP synthase subunit B [Nitrospinota bacterium]MDP7581449.1 F0F1 ATP synthase subunit B [Nitrospinota bacterium]HJN03274.1 F0F1 ATP synthase subunit B [Nitrospinota bacterium]|tara:strand:- start:1102 stop:1590 length:489 start_codon:yes stop_codon:yes gene_type:complete
MESLDFRLIIVQGIGFVLLYFLLKKFLFGRIIDLIKARENEIRDTYAKSDQDRDEASKLKSDYEARIAQAEEEAHKKIQEAVLEAKKISDNIVKNTKEETEKIKEKAKRDIDQEKKNALVEIRKEVVNLSMIATEKLIEKSVDKKTAEKLIESAIQDIGEVS